MGFFFANVARTNAFRDIRAEWNLATNAGISPFAFLRQYNGILGILDAFGHPFARDFLVFRAPKTPKVPCATATFSARDDFHPIFTKFT